MRKTTITFIILPLFVCFGYTQRTITELDSVSTVNGKELLISLPSGERVYRQLRTDKILNYINQNIAIDSTRLSQDSILVHYQGGVIVARDTLAITETDIIALGALVDTAQAIRLDFPTGFSGVFSDLTGIPSGLSDGDDFGTHIATQNIQTDGNWISGDGDSEGLYITSIGRVGFGTSSPGAQFDIRSTNTSTIPFRLTRFAGQTARMLYISNEVGAPFLSMNSSGQLGVKKDPAYDLDVSGTVGFPSLTQDNALTDILVQDGSGQLFTRDASSLPVPTLDAVTTAGATTTNQMNVGDITSTGNFLMEKGGVPFRMRIVGGSNEVASIGGNENAGLDLIQIGTEVHSITNSIFSIRKGVFDFSDGNVGIGTSTPAYDLDVSGTVGFPSLTQDNALTDILVQDGSGQLFTRDVSSLSGTDFSALTTNKYYTVDGSGNLIDGEIEIDTDITSIGDGALNANTDGSNNTAVGYRVLYSNTSGNNNAGLGQQSLYNNTTGTTNTAIGYVALYNNTTGDDNIGLGSQALYFNSEGNNNAALGFRSLYRNTTSNNNTGIGFRALYNNTTGNNNVALGSDAGNFSTGSQQLDSVRNSVFLGSLTKAGADNTNNQIVIGYNVEGLGSNSVVLGNDNIVTTALKGNVGIGTTSPAYDLDVSGTINADTIRANGTALNVPDYVFETDYNLPTIEEHTRKMLTLKHLPKASSAAKINTNGYDIVDEAMAHREELEIAHLYIAELNDKINNQEKIIQELLERIEKIENKN